MTHPIDHSGEAGQADSTELDLDEPLETTEPSATVYQIPARRGGEVNVVPEATPWFDDVNVLRGIMIAAGLAGGYAILSIIDELVHQSGH